MHIIRFIVRTLLFVLLAVLLLVAGTLATLYSPWTQDTLREALVRRFGAANGDTQISLDGFRLRPPLRVEATGVAIVQHGDTLMAADALEAGVALLPLLRGMVRVDDATLRGGYYRIGAPDSAMCLTIRAGQARIRPAEIELASMGIDVHDAELRHCRVDMLLNPDTAAADTSAAEASEMSIRLRRLRADSLTYSMRMLPAIDSLGVFMARADMSDGLIDMLPQTISLHSLRGTGLQAAYIAPDSATVAATPVAAASESTSAPWTVTIDSIGFDRSAALYTTRGVQPQPGLDFGYIAVDSLSLSIKDFYNRASTVTVPLTVAGTERCGLRLKAAGTLRVDSAALRLDTFSVATPTGTALAFDYMMGMGDMSDPSLPIGAKADGRISTPDMRTMFPAFTPYLATLPRSGVKVDADASGTMGRIDVRSLDLAMNGCVSLKARGSVSNPMDTRHIGADLTIDGRIADAAPIARSFMDPAMMKTVHIPPMTLDGHVRLRDGSAADARLTARTGRGSIALDGAFDMRGETYRADVRADAFPVNAFMPLAGVGRVTATLKADGSKLDIMSKAATLKAKAGIASAEYGGHTYTGISASADIAGGIADVDVTSTDPDMLAHITAKGNLDGDILDWEAYVDADRIDLKALNFATDEQTISASLRGRASVAPATMHFKAVVDLDRLQMRSPAAEYNISDVHADVSADSIVAAAVANGDLRADAHIQCPLDTLLARTDSISAVIDTMVSRHRIDALRLQKAIPHMTFATRAGNRNFINDILKNSKMGLDSLALDFSNDSTMALTGQVLGMRTASMRVDTIGLDVAQFGNNIFFNAAADNRPGTLDEFAHVMLSGMAMNDIAALRIRQRNIKEATGYDIGLQATMADSTARVSIIPLDPVIGYKPWTVNAGNFISYSFPDRHVDANIRMKGDGSALDIYTEHVDGSHDQEDLVVSVSDIHLQDWIALNPFAPPVKGDLSALIRLNYNDNKQLNGRGTIDLTKFYYGRERVADIHAQADVSTMPGGAVTATADVSFDGHRAITLRGALNDSTLTSPLNLDLSVISLPLKVANPFLGADLGRLDGTLNGSIDIEGTSDRQTLNGWLALDSASVFLAMTATDYRITADTVPVVNNLARLKDFDIYGVNGNPLALNGTVDIHNFASPQIDLSIRGRDVQLVNSRRAARGADVYGKAFIDLDASAAGNFELMRVNAALKVLSGTNVTYVMPDAVETLQSKSSGQMVKFVNFTDSAAMAQADSVAPSGMAMVLDASVTFEPASTVCVDLSADGKNKAQLQPTGELTYSLTPMNGDGRVSGRLNIDAGFVRYTPPFMSEKLFRFRPDSYVAFNGNMMNPTLNIQAVDVIKANVTQEGQNSRLVNFDVGLSVTGTLEQMKVAFDLSTDDDITVANELQAMSPEQRANQAMNMLLYNVYSGPGTRGNAAIGGNALFSFLEGQLNSWASNTIRGVDISFGIDQYDRTVDGNTSSTMSYSYQVSKSLFDDRFKIVVGGNYSTDANADENFSQNLINDISFEYFLNRAQTMYIRLFRHTGYESILEGEITKTGVGFVYKHKLNSLRDIFRRRKPAATAAESDENTASPRAQEQ
ncbi:MAG: translocation/assembly module TamB [Muribaculaceae bacterium]|nr:translocation/assembly module TamB [Muribaculaceae bacterium]